MKFKELTEEDIQKIAYIYYDKEKSYDDRMNAISAFIDKSKRTVHTWMSKLGIQEKVECDSLQYKEARNRKFDKKKNKFIITWAQNNTPVHDAFISNIEAYALSINASIHVIAGRYKNPTSIFTDSEEIWSSRITSYLDANRHKIHKYMWIMSDVKIQPTAVNPMTGLQGITGINSCIFGSPKVHLEMIPVLHDCVPKMMMTTGACTRKNYTDSKAGKKGEFHHTLGFVIVEIKDDEVFFSRQVTADDNGDFHDLYYHVKYDTIAKESKINKINKISGIVLGDIHYGQHDEHVINETLKLIKKLNPENVILHDVFDGFSINHHELNDPFIQFKKENDGTNSLKDEIEVMLNGLEAFKDYNVSIVRSNHDDFLDRWLKNTDWRKANTMKNSIEYMEYSWLLLKNAAPNGIIPFLIRGKYPKMKTLNRNDSLIINGWEVAQHGDIGSNGSRGSLLQFRKLNTKIIVGHYHSPERKDGALSVGTSTKLRVNYNQGPSSWLHSHVIIHTDGKAQHINFLNGHFTTFK